MNIQDQEQLTQLFFDNDRHPYERSAATVAEGEHHEGDKGPEAVDKNSETKRVHWSSVEEDCESHIQQNKLTTDVDKHKCSREAAKKSNPGTDYDTWTQYKPLELLKLPTKPLLEESKPDEVIREAQVHVPALIGTIIESKDIHRPKVDWAQTEKEIILHIYLRKVRSFGPSELNPCKKLKLWVNGISSLSCQSESEIPRESTELQYYQFEVNLFGHIHCVESPYLAYFLGEDCLVVAFDKIEGSRFVWPSLTEELTTRQQYHQSSQPTSLDADLPLSTDNNNSDNINTSQSFKENEKYPIDCDKKSRDCFDDIELYLNQLNKQQHNNIGEKILLPSECIPLKKSVEEDQPQTEEIKTKSPIPTTNKTDFDSTFKEAFRRYYSNPKQQPVKTGRIEYPEYNSEIFNPFRKTSHNLKLKSVKKRNTNNSNNKETNDKSINSNRHCSDNDKMKYDYRREATRSASDGAGASSIDSGRNTARHALDYKKTYLFLYNVLLFVMFLMVNMILTIKVISGTIDDDSVNGAAHIIKLLTYTQLLESIHPILGLVPGGPMMPLLQVFGRIVVNIFLTDPVIRISSAPYAHYLFIVWSCIEIFRYSFYALRVFRVEIYPITWCRYTLFMPLYPMGGFCEARVIMSTIEQYGKSGTYSVGLPNAANISFNLPIFLKFYIYFLLAPSIYYLMTYMWSQRCKQLNRKEKLA